MKERFFEYIHRKSVKDFLIGVAFVWGITGFIAIGFTAGCLYSNTKHVKDYEAACLFSDIIRCAMDAEAPVGPEVQELYNEWTQDIDFRVYKFDSLREEDLDDYCWCY